MSTDRTFVEALRARGWKFTPARSSCPMCVPARYPSPPEDLVQLLSSFELLCSGDESQWLIAATDYSANDSSSFTWDEFERMSLAAAADQPSWSREVEAFWDAHIPIFMSVRGHYSYAAYCCSGSNAGRYVTGSEPEFEQIAVVGSSLEEFKSWVLREINT